MKRPPLLLPILLLLLNSHLLAEPRKTELENLPVAMVCGYPISSCYIPDYRIGALFIPDSPLIVSGTIEGSAASVAGIEEGDRILAVNGIKVSKAKSLKSIVSAAGPQELTLTLVRSKKEIRLDVTPKMVPIVYRDVVLDVEIRPLYPEDGKDDLEIIGPLTKDE